MRLVTTALDGVWSKQEERLLFLGEWCKLNELGQRDCAGIPTVPYHWQDRTKIQSDYEYLQGFYDQLLELLSNALNSHHDTKYPILFWRILIGPWLLTYLSVIWDRFESVKIAAQSFNIDSIVSFSKESEFVAQDYSDSLRLFNDHSWNQSSIEKIIKYNFKNIEIIRAAGFFPPRCNKLRKKSPWPRKLYLLADRILSVLPQTKRVMLYQHYFPRKAYILLSLKLGQLPRLFLDFEREVLLPKADKRLRSQLAISREVGSAFEKYVYTNIFKDIPVSYLEGLPHLISSAKKIKERPSIIFTANAHYGNELFKVWAGLMCCFTPVKLVTSDHGGSMRPLMSEFRHAEAISYRKVVWGLGSCDNHVRLPAQKLLDCKRDVPTGGQDCKLIGLEFPPYSYRCQSGPNSSLCLEDFKQKTTFINLLSSDVFKKLKIRPYPDRGWNFSEKYEDLYGVEKIEQAVSLMDSIRSAKILICTYPQTTFLEAMSSCKPTILLCTARYWEHEKIFEDVFLEMSNASIIFSSAKEAAQHINEIWADPLAWWDAPQTIKARKRFFNICGGKRSKGDIEKWVHFFKSCEYD